MAHPLRTSALICLASTFALGSQAENASPDGKRFVDHWAERVPDIHSLRFRWVRVTTTARTERPRRDRKPVPKPPTPMESKEILIIEKDRMRFETAGLAYNEPANDYANQKYISNYKDGTSRVFYDLSGDAPRRVGFVTKRADNQDCDNDHLRPMMLFCLPLSPRYSPFKGAADCRLADAEREIQGRRCRALIKGHEYYWFDPSRDNAVLRYGVTMGGRVAIRREISYKDDPIYGPIPSRWATNVFGGDNVVTESSTVTVMSYEINQEFA